MVVEIVGTRDAIKKAKLKAYILNIEDKGSFSGFIEEFSRYASKKGYEVTVSCEYSDNKIKEYEGIRLYYFPYSPPKSYFLGKFYEIFSDVYFIYKLGKEMGVIYLLGGGAGAFLFIPKILRRKIKIMINIDGLEWKRDKFSKIEKILLKLNIKFATLFADIIIIDSEAMKKYVDKSLHNKVVYIPYGIEEIKDIEWNLKKLEEFGINGLLSYSYWLVVARLEPENNIHTIIQGFLKSNSKKPLVIVGDFTSEKYRKKIHEILKEDKENRVIMTGAIYDRETLFMLRQHCFGYIHGHSVGGTNPSLLEAMIMKNLIIAHDNEFNREVGENTILYFKNEDELVEVIKKVEKEPDNYTHLKEFAYERVKSKYSWDDVIGKYEKLIENLATKDLR